jgi:hypothetical protein
VVAAVGEVTALLEAVAVVVESLMVGLLLNQVASLEQVAVVIPLVDIQDMDT